MCQLGAGIVPIYGQKLSPRWELLGRLLEIHRQGVVTWGFPACAGDEQGFQANSDVFPKDGSYSLRGVVLQSFKVHVTSPLRMGFLD